MVGVAFLGGSNWIKNGFDWSEDTYQSCILLRFSNSIQNDLFTILTIFAEKRINFESLIIHLRRVGLCRLCTEKLSAEV